MLKINSLRVLLSLLIVNAAGYTLKFFELDSYIIVIGFRFHLSFLLPLLVIFHTDQLAAFKKYFLNPSYKGKIQPLLWVIMSFVLIMFSLLAMGYSEIADPEYFYEFGASSVIDYPVYLLWNFPQFILLFFYLSVVTVSVRKKILPVSLLIIFLFAYEFIPADVLTINYIPYIELFLTSVAAGIFFQFFNNIYWFAVLFFSIFWINLLAFGSESSILINILFAAQYSEWEGFFTSDMLIQPYLLAVNLLLMIIVMLLSVRFRAKEKSG